MIVKAKIANLIGDVRPRTSLSDLATAPNAPPSAKVLVFSPLQPPAYVRRMGQVIKGAKSAEWGEIYLQRDLEMFTRDLIAAGADPLEVRREVRALECAIRAEVWRVILLPERDDART